MFMKPLSLLDIKHCYQTYLIEHFPKNEIRSFQSIETLYHQGLYEGYGYFKEDQLIAYAFCVHSHMYPTRLLDYYAVIPAARQCGIGSLFLTQLAAFLHTPGLMIEVETPSPLVSTEENETRLRRITFYERNGARLTRIGGDVFEVHFTLMYLPIEAPLRDDEILLMIQMLYQKMVPPHLYERFVHYQLLDSHGN